MRPASLALAGILLPADLPRRFRRQDRHAATSRRPFWTGKPFTASTTSGTEFKMIFTADRKSPRQPWGKSGKKSSGTWKLDA